MPKPTIARKPLLVQEVAPAEGDFVRVIDGECRGMYGKLQTIKYRKGFAYYHPICLVILPGIGTRIFLRDEIERVESEVRG